MQTGNKTARPFWRTDLKWVFGLFFALFFLATTVLYILSRLTSPEVAVPTATYIVASQFSKEGLDDEKSVEEVRKKILASGQAKYYPFGQDQNVYLTRQDIQNLSAKEIRLKTFSQLVEPIYYQKSSPESLKQYGVLAKMNEDTHNFLQRIFLISLIPTVLFLIGLIAFSAGYGKLISPAVILLIFGAPLSLLLLLITHVSPPPGDNGPLSFIPQDLIPSLAKTIGQPFYLYSLTAIALFVLAIIIRIFRGKPQNKTGK